MKHLETRICDQDGDGVQLRLHIGSFCCCHCIFIALQGDAGPQSNVYTFQTGSSRPSHFENIWFTFCVGPLLFTFLPDSFQKIFVCFGKGQRKKKIPAPALRDDIHDDKTNTDALFITEHET